MLTYSKPSRGPYQTNPMSAMWRAYEHVNSCTAGQLCSWIFEQLGCYPAGPLNGSLSTWAGWLCIWRAVQLDSCMAGQLDGAEWLKFGLGSCTAHQLCEPWKHPSVHPAIHRTALETSISPSSNPMPMTRKVQNFKTSVAND